MATTRQQNTPATVQRDLRPVIILGVSILISNVAVSIPNPQYGKTETMSCCSHLAPDTELLLTTSAMRIETANWGDLTTPRMLKRRQSLGGRDECAIFWKPNRHRVYKPFGEFVIIGDEQKVVDISN